MFDLSRDCTSKGVNSLCSLLLNMQTPNIKTSFGLLPVTCLSDDRLVDAYLSVSNEPEDVDVVQLLRYAFSCQSDGSNQSGTILRECLAGGGLLVPIYPGSGQTPPAGAKLLGNIMDGALYFVSVPYTAKSLNNKTIFDFTGDAALIEHITGVSPSNLKAVAFYLGDGCHVINKAKHIETLAIMQNNRGLAAAASDLQRKVILTAGLLSLKNRGL